MTPPPRKPAAAKGLSLHIGVNAVNSRHYGGFDGTLLACELDAADLAALAHRAGMKPTVLSGSKATRANVLAGIRKAAGQLERGDLFLLSFSGFGGQLPDLHDAGESDRPNDTWCLYDGQLIDDELMAGCATGPPGARVVVLADCSYTGTVTRASAPLFLRPSGASATRIRMMPPATALRTYTQNRTFYDKLQKDRAREAGTHGSLELLLISGAQDYQSAIEDERNGEFTKNLLAVWADGTFTGDYQRFVTAIAGRMPPGQTPSITSLGAGKRLMRERPFTV